MVGFGLLEGNYLRSPRNHKDLVPGFHLQSLAGFTRDHNLVFR